MRLRWLRPCYVDVVGRLFWAAHLMTSEFFSLMGSLKVGYSSIVAVGFCVRALLLPIMASSTS